MDASQLFDHYLPFIFITARVSGLFLLSPVYGAAMIPARLKAALVIVVSLVLHFGMNVGSEIVTLDTSVIVQYGIREFITGVGMGMIVSLTFHAVGLAGAVLAPQMGFAMSEVVDPQSQSSVSVLSSFFYLISLAFFVAIDGHLILIRALAESYKLLPLGQWVLSDGFVGFLMKAGSGMFVIAFTISAPILAVVLFVNAGMSMMARAVPQMNIFVVGFIIMISSGLVAMALFLPYYGAYLSERLIGAMEQMLWLLKTV